MVKSSLEDLAVPNQVIKYKAPRQTVLESEIHTHVSRLEASG